jgi:hypothetical protein
MVTNKQNTLRGKTWTQKATAITMYMHTHAHIVAYSKIINLEIFLFRTKWALYVVGST